ncbi:hypothetical protein PL963_P200102 (plasmid) [Pseudomonas cerasi]|uniref:Uncharacterized protein n=1 Tax=Pseudomonas cerasi TaxID=1583341 RepID=A0A2K4W2U9_9PSED|nr:hypothetical protein PL963_P200102 [Pseudomonas cerasi]
MWRVRRLSGYPPRFPVYILYPSFRPFSAWRHYCRETNVWRQTAPLLAFRP